MHQFSIMLQYTIAVLDDAEVWRNDGTVNSRSVAISYELLEHKA